MDVEPKHATFNIFPRGLISAGRHVDPVTGCLHSTRLLTKTNSKPKWMDKVWRWRTTVLVTALQFVESTAAFIVEESVVDPRRRTMATFTKNITLNKFMTVEETCEYRQSPDSPAWSARACGTSALTPRRTSTSTHVSVSSSLYSIGGIVEKFGIERFKSNIKKAGRRVRQAGTDCIAVAAGPAVHAGPVLPGVRRRASPPL